MTVKLRKVWYIHPTKSFICYCSIKFKTALSPSHINSPTNDDWWETIPQDFPDHTYWHLQAVLSMLFPVRLYMLHVNVNAIYVYNVHLCYVPDDVFIQMSKTWTENSQQCWTEYGQQCLILLGRQCSGQLQTVLTPCSSKINSCFLWFRQFWWKESLFLRFVTRYAAPPQS